LLLDAGADVHAKNDEALRWASANGHTDTVKLLREWIEREKDAPPPDKVVARGPEAGEAEYASWALAVPATPQVPEVKLLDLPMPMPPRQSPKLRLPDPL